MASAYAAVVSLMHTIDQIQNHPRPPISLNKKQVKSLTKNITFLLELLEACNFRGGREEEDLLQFRIRDAAFAAEDVIESHIVDQILARSTSTNDGERINSVDLCRDLQKVIQDMNLIKKEVIEVKEYKMAIQDHRQKSSPADVPGRYPFTGRLTIVGFDDVAYKFICKLFESQPDLQIVTIIGIMGIGKTTLVRCVYENSLADHCFDIHAWVTISPEHNAKEILVEVLLCQKNQGNRKSLSEKSVEKLGQILNKSLSDKKYLIVLDNMWSIEMWDEVKPYFPDNDNESRIILTTRQSQLASNLASTHIIQMNFLDEESSWHLLREIVFGYSGCPTKLEIIGRQIAENCNGLPLSIVIVGRLLEKSNLTYQDRAYVEENLRSIESVEAEEHCLKVLHTSYNLLPVHLKPCLIYMLIFPKNNEIRVSQLIKLWVVEGILRPINGKTLEEVVEEYLNDLVDRNLVLVCKWGSSYRKIKSCYINHPLRDLCMREAYKDMFCVRTENNLVLPNRMNTQRRIAIDGVGNFPKVCHALQCASPTRSLICNVHEVLPSLAFRLLRVLKAVDWCSYDGEEGHNLDAFLQLLNLRHLDISNGWNRISTLVFPSSVHLMWNLQTLIIKDSKEKAIAPPEIWKMPQLKHVEFNELSLPDPPSDHVDMEDDFVLGNLQTLLKVVNFKFGDEVVKRIPNVKKLQLSYEEFEEGFDAASYYCLNNLGRLQKLESLACSFFDGPRRSDLLHNLTFPHSLKDLTLYGTEFYWEDMSTMIGSLPLLEVLKLKHRSFIGRKWEPVEGQFLSLRVLKIDYCDSLRHWLTDCCAFPRLRRLVLRYLYKLEEIPWDFAVLGTLKLIQLDFCSKSSVISAKRTLEKQEGIGNEDLQVKVLLLEENHELQSLESPNFQVRVFSEA